jgi:GT2 family glycosyltransferase
MSSETTGKGTASKSRMAAKHKPAVVLHSATDPSGTASGLESFRQLGWNAWSAEGARAEPGESGPEQLGELLLEHQRRSAGSGLLILDARLPITERSITALLALMDEVSQEGYEPFVLTVLSNASPGLNPYSGLERADGSEPGSGILEDLVALVGPGQVHRHHVWPRHLLFFSAEAAHLLAQSDTTMENALERLDEQEGRLLVADSLFIHQPGSGLLEQVRLDPQEQRRPVAWGQLTQRLDSWLRAELPEFREPGPGEKSATLHISHSWGGGVSQWVESFIESDQNGLNFQLRSEGPQSGEGAGQRLSLYFGRQTSTPVASWWLQPPVRSTAVKNSQYRRILLEIARRYGVGRVIVSSLVGHSLDALSTGLPTAQVLHDYYPRWPLLDIHPGQYLDDGESASLEQALSENRLLPDFRGRDASSWEALASAWHEAISTWAVNVVAPSRSVADMLRRLDPAWTEIDIEIIPHGLPPMPTGQEVLPRDRKDGKLRLVVPGRIQAGKGRDLLREALPELSNYAHIYLVGAGKEGEVFFGRSGVSVILQYDRNDLPGIMASIGPQLTALLSVVPETFSYTLSEMQQLNIPVVATRVGSLEERVADGETGWLIEPDAASLIEMVKFLSENRNVVEEMHSRLSELTHPDAVQMLGKYDQLCMPRPVRKRWLAGQQSESAQLGALAFEQVHLKKRVRELYSRTKEQQREVESRTQWAEERQHALEKEQELRERWVNSLEEQLENERELRDRWVNKLNEQLDERFTELQAARQALDKTGTALEQSRSQYKHLKARHDWVLSSKSWRITRPFRVGRRILKNFIEARAWNPLRWPLLISQSVRTLKTQGPRGALMRSQLAHQKVFIPESFNAERVEEVGSPETPASFPMIAEPVVSIVIPVYNKWIYTAACLRSLAETSCSTSFEVIVVDDQSADESAEMLDAIDGLTCIRNEENLGFGGSCNRGAREARGTYIVMLNNDTQVLDGWLDSLLDTFERFPDTGLAGARLIFPDGTLQENGGIIFNDGSGWNYGRNDDADRPEYQYTREVDYCSGACIMLKTELFNELEGFDNRYSPAYYEDTDLAFRVRARGLKVRVQPRATIVHYEGITSGTDPGSGTKRHQAANRIKFLERWKDELAAYPDPVANPDDRQAVRQARDHHLKGRILIIDAYTPEPDQDSGSLRLRYLLDCFTSLGYGVTFFAANRGHAGVYTTDMQQAAVEVIYNPWLESLHGFFRERGADFSFVMISRHYVAVNYISLLERYCPDARFIFDTVDLHYLREERLAELEDSLPLKRVATQTRRSELAVIKAADATLVVSPFEKSVLEQAAPDARVHVISNVHEVVGSRRPWSQRKDIFFVGGYQHPPNVDAAIWFVSSVWPLVRKQLPEISFHLIGSKATEQIRSLHGNGVQFHGFVKSLEPWLDQCRLAVAPLRYGAGVKGKVNISMSRGQPVVATPTAVEGMFVSSGEEVLIAEGAEEFAAGIVRLYQDEQLWNHISIAGLENVSKYFSVETARLSLQELLKTLN